MRRIAGCLLTMSVMMHGSDLRNKIDHIIVVYFENRSFDHLFHGFSGTDRSDSLNRFPQVDYHNYPYAFLQMSEEGKKLGFPERVANGPLALDGVVKQTDIIPDMVHRFYQNQLQINGGKNNRFVDISDQKALSMGYHDMNGSALWAYAQEFTLCDRFFAAAFGGSFLNHQWLIAAQTPFVGKDSNLSRYELSSTGEIVRDGILTPDGYAVNTIQPFYPPYKSKYADPSQRLKPLNYDTIGDRLSEASISWKWYSGGYDEAIRGNGEKVVYQYHHNPFLYFERYAPDSEGRTHLQDEKRFYEDITNNALPSVVFIKPSAEDNQHPGYATVQKADEKLKTIVESVRANKKVWERSVIIVTYDENGGLWDHVAPPAGDRWGPGTRIPALVISPVAKKGYVDHTPYDTTSILRFIEWRYGLAPLGKRTVNDLRNTLIKE